MRVFAAFVRICPTLTLVMLILVWIALAIVFFGCASKRIPADCRQYGCAAGQECRSAATVHRCFLTLTDRL